MLERIRRPSRAKGILAYLIFGAIIIVFVGFGVVPDRMSDDATGVAAVVNRSQISLADFRDRVQALERQYQMRVDQTPASQRAELNRALRQRAMEDLIEFEVMVQEATARGVRVADEEVRDFIVNIPGFQKDGRFKRDLYDLYLAQRQMSAGQFEDKIRKELIVRKAQALFQAALKPSALETAKDKEIESVKLNLEVATFADEELKSRLPISAAEVTAFLADQGNLEKIKKSYEDNQAQFSEPEQVRARHILVAIDRNDAKSEPRAKAKIDEISERLKKEDFAAVARQVSDDPGSKGQGGDLGYFAKGRMVKEFEEAAFRAPVGQLLPPVRTDFGYHLIKVEDRKAARTKTFDEAKDVLARSEIAKSKVEDFVKNIEAAVKTADEGRVRKIVKELGLEWQETGDFNLDAAQIPRLIDADRALEAVLKSGTQKGVVPELIKVKGQTQLLVMKSWKVSGEDAGLLADYISSRKFFDAFNGWAKAALDRAAIRRNNSILTN